MTKIDVSKENAYVVLALPSDRQFVTKVTAYAVLASPPTPPGHVKTNIVIN